MLEAAPLGVEQVGRPVQGDDGLARARPAGDLGDAPGGGPDGLVLVPLDRRDDVAHLPAAAAGEGGHQGAVADDDDVVRRLRHHEVVLDPDDTRPAAAQHASAHDAHRVDGRRPVEGRRRRRPPVDDERLVVVVAHPEPADVPHLALGRGGVLLAEVEPAEDEPLVLRVDHRPAPGGGEDEGVALEEPGHLLVAHVTGAVGAAAGHAVGLDVAGAQRRLLQLGVDAVDVRLLGRDLPRDVGGRLGLARVVGRHEAELSSPGRGHGTHQSRRVRARARPGRHEGRRPGGRRARPPAAGPRLGRVKVLVIGSGAREHAVVRALSLDPAVDAVVAAPGNPGIEAVARCEPLPGGVSDAEAVVALARRHDVGLVVVGPEAPLVAGVADAVRSAGFPCFGPSARAARLEGSKAFAKEVMSAADVPTGMAHVCTTPEELADALDALGAPHVVKDDGLAAGKGVVVTDDRAAALEHGLACLDKPDGRVVVEEYLDGPEVSLFCVCDGTDVLPLSPAQDFKRVGDGDAGPNTGGMGAYSPLDWAPDGLVDDVVRRIARPVVDEMARRGTPFVGVLYVGLALTTRGPRVIEFNVRFGDPETQVVLERLRTPLGQLLLAAAEGRLAETEPLRWADEHAVTVVVAARDYPAAPRTGDAVTGVDDVPGAPDAYVLHAGTGRDADGVLVSAGGRVLSVVGRGATLAEARERAYVAVDAVGLDGSHHRRDIAERAERGEVTVPA